ncbi:hypothetical protein JWG45_05210 [Leptospira sp. 201903070]|uniref:Uncharacterized protein n=1 Tax=Leptospira ainlahdjerensis TaxID=2810033 RepID=A0ABS2U8T8_9LEPT|nr:hypothetical protein [Leptospira ainlahdjerensis]MBM9576549.1 hypothetical protein [Leptospira ainlahdjerensis]
MKNLSRKRTTASRNFLNFFKNTKHKHRNSVRWISFVFVFLISNSGGWATELRYGELLFKCRSEKTRCSAREICVVEVFGHPKDGSYLDLFVSLYQGEEKNIKDPEYNYDTKIVLPATYDVKAGKYTIRVNASEFPLNFFLEILTNPKKPELASTGFFRENPGDDPIRYYCRQLKSGY